ncbi:hypothetical protein DAPPUDRAFT_300629 [Daphnia pulex]|uniref:Uncharacterized protein n=1 Tax=Daphnia pulex TaxID=6669 RepID=E9HE99_DAPPU|nr:hypothetical protein DAPPUDRAFT_300629 [Daphnia pulex]|eukprot:EFX69894.1 hypothetical protein DAPPUDRAFT_300629 [Daphnia pulex]
MTRNIIYTWPKSKSLWGCCSCTRKKGREAAGRERGWTLHKFTALSQSHKTKAQPKERSGHLLLYIVRVVGVSDSLTTFQSLYSFFLFNGGKRERRPPVRRSVRKFRLSHISTYREREYKTVRDGGVGAARP